MTEQEALEQFRRIILEVLAHHGINLHHITPADVHWFDIDCDELDFVECVMALEDAFDIDIAETELENLPYIDQLWELVKSRLSLAPV